MINDSSDMNRLDLYGSCPCGSGQEYDECARQYLTNVTMKYITNIIRVGNNARTLPPNYYLFSDNHAGVQLLGKTSEGNFVFISAWKMPNSDVIDERAGIEIYKTAVNDWGNNWDSMKKFLESLRSKQPSHPKYLSQHGNSSIFNDVIDTALNIADMLTVGHELDYSKSVDDPAKPSPTQPDSVQYKKGSKEIVEKFLESLSKEQPDLPAKPQIIFPCNTIPTRTGSVTLAKGYYFEDGWHFGRTTGTIYLMHIESHEGSKGRIVKEFYYDPIDGKHPEDGMILEAVRNDVIKRQPMGMQK
ncbi:MAG: hypothetical protein V1802_00690 [Candidatus Aenigmatarchaeota archaeon]